MKCRLIPSFIILIPFLILVTGCSESPSIFKDQELTLDVDAEVTETWITLSSNPLKRTATYIVQRDTTIIFEGRLHSADTLIHDTGLEPATAYSYTAWTRKGGDSSERTTTTATTMDTTSHDFEWEVFEFGGENGSSVLYDVAIINENDIWAVGEIYTEDTYTRDSLGNLIKPYNAVHWDGEEWELKRIETNQCGGVQYPPIKTVFSFSEGEILFAHFDGSITYYDGSAFINDCSLITELDGSANKIWGTSKNDFYVVSGDGLIAHYDGQGWTRIENESHIDLKDIWGIGKEIWACGWLANGQSVLIDVSDDEAELIWQSGLDSELLYSGVISTLWAINDRNFFLSGNGFFFKHALRNKNFIKKFSVDFGNFIYRLRGIQINDIFLVGDRSTVWHWNGFSWQNFSDLYNHGTKLYSVDYKNDKIVAVGFSSIGAFRNARIVVGKSN